jgi:DNA-binding transcriptional ArsR family regulator
MKERILELLLQKKSYSEISKEVGRSKATISYHAKVAGLSKSINQAEYNWDEVQKYYNECKSPVKTIEHFGMSRGSFSKSLKKGRLKWVDPKIPLENLLIKNREISTSRQHLKERLKDVGLLKQECYECKITEWKNKPLSLHLDHINGNTNDNRLFNLRLLCPNCHSQTDTYGGRNKKYKSS